MNIKEVLCNWGSCGYFQVKAENDQLRGDLGLLRKQLSRNISLDDDRLQQMEIDELWEKVNINYLTTFLLLMLLFEGIYMQGKNIYIYPFLLALLFPMPSVTSIVLNLQHTFLKSFGCRFLFCIIISSLYLHRMIFVAWLVCK